MSFTIIDAPQGSEAWKQARCGRLTGSRASDVLATIKSGEAAARRDYRRQLVCERLTGRPQDDGFVSEAMQRGTDLEPIARRAYEAETGELVQQTGFLASVLLYAGCSLDGHVDDFAGIVEIKCPKSATHLKYLRAGTLPGEHRAQVLHNLWISGAQWCDVVSFDDRFDPDLALWICRVLRDEAAIAAYGMLAKAFLAEVETEYQAVRTMRNVGDVLREAVL